MIVEPGKGTTKYGTGILINLTGDEVATAIDAYLVCHGVITNGPRTVKINGELCDDAYVYVNPAGSIIHEGTYISGRTGKPLQ